MYHSGKELKKVIVCPPEREYFNVENLREHNFKEIPDRERAINQHAELRKRLKKCGVEVIEVKELSGHPNSVFTMDTAVSLNDGYIKLRMGLASRRGEDEWMAGILENLGLEKLGEIKAPGTAEGGDITVAYPYAFIGYSERTNKEGIIQLEKIFKDLGYESRIMRIPSQYLHLGGIMTFIGEDRVLACENGILEKEKLKGLEVFWIRCGGVVTANVIYTGGEKIICRMRNYEAQKLLIKEGYKVYPLDLSEFTKGSGGPTCLILPLERK